MKYKLIKQEQYYCVPRCLQMILDRYKLKFDSQEDIGKELGFIITEDYKGTRIQEQEYSISNYFDKHNLPLTFEYFYLTDYEEVKKFLIENKDNDIIVCYKRGVMFNKILKGGHATLIEKFENENVTLVYPEDDLGYRTVNLKSLINAIKLYDKKNMAGFWLIKNKPI